MALYQFDVLDSTNDYMKEHREEFQEYDIVLANNQRAGKGRRGNIWISTEGMALFTFLVKKKKEEEDLKYMKLPLLAGLATIRALKKMKKETYQFKWTNDIYLSDKKLGGILVERREDDFFVGIGLNINNAIPLEIQHIAISLRESGEGKEIFIPECVNTVVGEFQKVWEEYCQGKWKNLLEEMNRIHYLRGKKVSLRAGNFLIEGVVQEINEEGELEMLSQGELKSFGIGEVIRERIIVSLEAKKESFAKAYILKEASYDVIALLEGEFSPEWEKKLENLQLKVERNTSIEALKEKYRAKILQEFPDMFPLSEYSEEKIQEIAKMFA